MQALLQQLLRSHLPDLARLVDELDGHAALFDRGMRRLACSPSWRRDIGDVQPDQPAFGGGAERGGGPVTWSALHQRALAGESFRLDAGKGRLGDGRAGELRLAVLPWHEADGSVGGALFCAEALREAGAKDGPTRLGGESQQRVELALEGANLDMWECDLSAGGRFSNGPRLATMLGFAPGEIEPEQEAYQARLHPGDLAATRAAFAAHLRGATPRIEIEYRMRHKDGHWVWLLTRGRIVEHDAQGLPLRMAGTTLDVTEAKKSREREDRLDRAYRLLSRCDAALVHAQNEADLLHEICALSVEVGGYRMAWVGFLVHDAARSVRPVAWHGVEDGYLQGAGISWGEAEPGQGPFGTAVRTRATVIARDLPSDSSVARWREAALRRGYRSGIVLPLLIDEAPIGALVIYSADPQAFGREEAKLLEQLAADLAYGVRTLRMREELSRTLTALHGESAKNQALLRSASDGIHVLDQGGNLIEASDSFCRMLGYTREELLGRHVSQWDAQMDAVRLEQAIRDQFARRERSEFETRHRRKDGNSIDVEISGHPLTIDGRPVLFNSSRDITERKRAQESLRASEARFRALVEQSPVSMVFARDGLVLDANAAYLQTFALQGIEELRGRSVLERIAPRCRAEMADRIARRARGEPVEQDYEILGLRKDGIEIPLFVSARQVQLPDGPVTAAFLIDMSRQKASEEEVRRLAFYDPLTELPNRRLLQDRIAHAMAGSARSGAHGALLYIDLDDFKSLNDTLGHATGDELLRQVAARLRACVREGDSIARMGGDEFVVLLEDLSPQPLEAARQAEAIAEKVLASLRPGYQLLGSEYRSSASVGAALFSGHEIGSTDLVRVADIAMYQAKKAGRDSIRFFDPRMQQAILAQTELEMDLRQALEAGQFRLHYQVQVDRHDRPFGAEALIRWVHPQRGLVLPGQFIPVAERTDLIVPIGLWVLEAACAQLARWRTDERLRGLEVSVNVSARQLHGADFVAAVRDCVRRHAMDPQRLTLELTESVLLENVEDTIAKMQALGELGIRFALDDFGTGYSSLQYLKRLPLHELKIDRSFVNDIATDPNDLAIVQTIVAMARSLNLNVIAEGVETREQRALLVSRGCERFQGYLFGRPVAAAEFEAALQPLAAALADAR
jgi:diguanylate cyclase (GGDEF)-like protein/PAS domain S-box-containing protein